MASGEYRRPQSDNGVSFRCLRLKCELYLNVCLSISISLCPAHRLFNSFSTLRSTKITLSPSLSLSLPFIMQSANLSNRLQIDKLSTAIFALYLRILLLLLYGLHTHSKLLCKCSVSFFFAFWNVSDHTNNGFTDPLPGIWHTHDFDATHSAQRQIAWSVNQLTSCADSAVPRLGLSQN